LRILICGDRNWKDFAAIKRELHNLPHGSTIIHGDCRGADKIAGYIAKQLGLEVVAFPADWKNHGRAAGPIRNKQMLDDGKPDLVIAFHPDIASSKGTADMVKQARNRGLEVRIYPS
jgi:hypothetical protein